MTTVNKVVCNLDTVTHVIINGKEYERHSIKDGTGSPDGKAILVGLPCILKTDMPSAKALAKNPAKLPYNYFCRIGSAFGGKAINGHGFRLDYYPLKTGVTNSTETDFAG